MEEVVEKLERNIDKRGRKKGCCSHYKTVRIFSFFFCMVNYIIMYGQWIKSGMKNYKIYVESYIKCVEFLFLFSLHSLPTLVGVEKLRFNLHWFLIDEYLYQHTHSVCAMAFIIWELMMHKKCVCYQNSKAKIDCFVVSMIFVFGPVHLFLCSGSGSV